MKTNLYQTLCKFALGWISTMAVLAEAQTPDALTPTVNGSVAGLAVQPDGKIWIGGEFTTLNGQTSRGLGRVTANGASDLMFNPGATTQDPTYQPQIISFVIQPDGKVVAGGWFTSFQGLARTNIVRLNPNGTVDTMFNPAYASGIITSMAMQPDGKIIAVSGFNVFRINSDGSRDNTFNVSTSGSIASYLAIQTDGKILVLGGANLVVNNVTYSVNGLGRVNGNGSFDSTFTYFGSLQNNSGVPLALTVQPDGKVVVANYAPRYVSCGPGGGLCIDGYPVKLTRITGTGASETNVASLNVAYSNADVAKALTLQANSKFIVVSDKIRRTSLDGSTDLTFNTTATGNVMALQPDGKLLFGGPVGRLVNNEPPTQTLAYSNSTITWLRGGSCPEVWRTTFEYSTDRGTNWINIGAGTRITGGWQRTGVAIPSNATIRARGSVVAGDSSSWFVENLLIGERPAILVNDGSLGVYSNQFGFKLTGYPGSSVVVEASTNLNDWLPLQTNTLTFAPLAFADADYTNYPNRYYRLRKP